MDPFFVINNSHAGYLFEILNLFQNIGQASFKSSQKENIG